MPARLVWDVSIGDVFTNWTVVGARTGKQCTCRCVCGATEQVTVRKLHLGMTKSCGCQKADLIRSALNGHGHASIGGRRSPTYVSWANMIRRCTDPKFGKYHLYGGRGIEVCERWRESFVAFLADMGERPEGMTLDRFPDNNGNYEPSNCRWATPKEQRDNQRPCRRRRKP